MSILAQNHTDEVALLNCIQIFFVKHHVGKLLKQCNGTKDLTDASRKNVFIIDDSLINRTSCKKTELGSKVFDHTGMNYKKGYRMLTLLDTAVSSGLSAEYVLFDSWFSNPSQITTIKRKGMDVISMIKKSSRIKYTYNDEQLSAFIADFESRLPEYLRNALHPGTAMA